MIAADSHLTACGRTIGDDWAGEYTEQPSGPVTCKRCLPHAEIHAAEIAAAAADLATFQIGDRVGILTGVQSVGGAYVGDHGTVTAHFTEWGHVDYVVTADGESEGYVYNAWQLTREDAPTDAEIAAVTAVAIPVSVAAAILGNPAVTDVRVIESARAAVPTGDAETVARVSADIAAALSPRSWEEIGRSEARAASMAAHPASKGRTVKMTSLPPVPRAQRWIGSNGEVYTWGVCDWDGMENAVTRVSLGESGTVYVCTSHRHNV